MKILTLVIVIAVIAIMSFFMKTQQPTDQIQVLTESLVKYKMIKEATYRKDLLLKEMETSPSAFLKHAVLTRQRDNFPEEIRPFIEEEVELTGTLTVVIVDDFENKISTTEYLLEEVTSMQQYRLYFSGNPPPLTSGSIIKIKGIRLEQNIVILVL